MRFEYSAFSSNQKCDWCDAVFENILRIKLENIWKSIKLLFLFFRSLILVIDFGFTCAAHTKTGIQLQLRISNWNRFEHFFFLTANEKEHPFQEIKEFYGFILSLGHFLLRLNSDFDRNSFRIFDSFKIETPAFISSTTYNAAQNVQCLTHVYQLLCILSNVRFSCALLLFLFVFSRFFSWFWFNGRVYQNLKIFARFVFSLVESNKPTQLR